MIKLKLILVLIVGIILINSPESKASEKNSQNNPNIQAYKEASLRIDKYAVSVFHNYEKNLKKIDSMNSNIKKYYKNNLQSEASGGRIDSLFEHAEREKSLAYESLRTLKIQANNFKKNKNGLPSVVHSFQRDIYQAITNFDNYKVAVINLASEVKETSNSMESKKSKNSKDDK